MIDIEQYIQDPCRTLATAFWKASHFPIPPNVVIAHKSDLAMHDTNFNGQVTTYFRLLNRLDTQNHFPLPNGFNFRQVSLPDDAATLADIINRSYNSYSHTADSIMRWTNHPVFDPSLWLFVIDDLTNNPAAAGLADFDNTITEGSLEWIQVLPEYRGRGLGQAIVCELVNRLKHGNKAAFVTVSGECDNKTNPEALYRKCGFTGDDIWYVKFLQEVK